jgi:hypothetical protein
MEKGQESGTGCKNLGKMEPGASCPYKSDPFYDYKKLNYPGLYRVSRALLHYDSMSLSSGVSMPGEGLGGVLNGALGRDRSSSVRLFGQLSFA